VGEVLGARPPAGVRAPSRAIGVDRDPAALMHGPPDEQARVYGVPARAAWKSSIAWRSGSKATQIHAGVPPTLTIASSMNMRRTSLGSAPMDPRIGTRSLHTPPYRRAALLMGLRDFGARLSEGPER
jgi:hypothetical protein